MKIKTFLTMVLWIWAGVVQAAPDPNLSLMTFNIRFGSADDGPNHWNLRKKMVFDVIKDQAPDVVGLQEALDFQIEQIKAAVPGYAHLGVGRDDGKSEGEFTAILYRSDRLAVLDSNCFWLSDTPEVPGSITWGNACTRICTWGRFQDKITGQHFYLYNLHLDYASQVSRDKGVALILQRIGQRPSPDPVFITGDFNADENNSAIKAIKNATVSAQIRSDSTPQTVHFIDTFRRLHPDAQQVGTFNQFRGIDTGGKIDFIWALEGIKVLKAEILHTNTEGRYPSDHFPVVATVIP